MKINATERDYISRHCAGDLKALCWRFEGTGVQKYIRSLPSCGLDSAFVSEGVITKPYKLGGFKQ